MLVGAGSSEDTRHRLCSYFTSEDGCSGAESRECKDQVGALSAALLQLSAYRRNQLGLTPGVMAARSDTAARVVTAPVTTASDVLYVRLDNRASLGTLWRSSTSQPHFPED